MAVTGTNLDPSAVLEWNATNYNLVRRIETTDAVLGGNPTRPDPNNPLTEVVLNSAVNFALETLAARTKWLKKEVEKLKAATFDINALTAETQANDADEVAIYDVSAGSMRKMTRENFVAGIAKPVRTKILSGLTFGTGSDSNKIWLSTAQGTIFNAALTAGKDLAFIWTSVKTNPGYLGGTLLQGFFWNPGVTPDGTQKWIQFPSTWFSPGANNPSVGSILIRYSTNTSWPVRITVQSTSGSIRDSDADARLDIWSVG